jgi:hypothetical protein
MADNSPITGAQILPFKKPIRRDADGSLYVPPPALPFGSVYVFYGFNKPRQRKRRWYIVIEFLDLSHDIENGPGDWGAAMLLAKVRARKYGFRVVDLSDAFEETPRLSVDPVTVSEGADHV